jgi:3-hydroxybutyryl-CoA dehydrogenase
MSDLFQVAVLGFGTMGAGIAQVLAQSGRSVVVLEADEARIKAGFAALEAFLDGGVKRGKLTAQQRDEVAARVRGTTAIDELAPAELVIEAVTEDADVKRSLLVRVAGVVSAETVIATNTSALSVTELATAVPRPERFAGLHFFNPAPLMKLVEVVRALQSDAAVIDKLVEFTRSIGKEPVVVKDRPGFLVNLLLMPYLNDAVQLYDDELASAEDMDTAVKLGLGHKLGPLELLDLIGLDVHLAATTSAYQATLDPKFAPPTLLSRLVAAGYRGAKNGRGLRVGVERVEGEA